MDPLSRRDQILDKATGYFAEFGLSAPVRELALHIGVSPALIFRYFESKDALIGEVYGRLFVKQLDQSWIALLTDRSTALDVRLNEFYARYAQVADDYRWIRVALYSALNGYSLMREYLNSFMRDILRTMALEINHEFRGGKAVAEEDIELVWTLHSSLIYTLIRKHVHHSKTPPDLAAQLSATISHFLRGFARTTVK